MNFYGRNHPKSQESLCRDALMAGKSSLQNKKQISRCSSGQNSQNNQRSQIRKASAIREAREASAARKARLSQ